MMRSILANTVHAEELVIINKGPIKGHRVLNRNRARGHLMLVDNYIALDAPSEPYFRGHFRMRWQVFDRLYHGVRAYDDYFTLKKDAIRTIGFSGYQKYISAMRMFAYSTTADSQDEHLRMSENTCLEVIVKFATAEVKVFGLEYLRELTPADLECTQWKWEKFPYA
ncbi:uncharacterized protein [Aegilops tauschii subsp. strangulata]|uniref:uncharacterized protein n=1 Tax=Aegilops tauschii subsp. strangulata TaxID=200361 RepID=UPI00098B4A3E|nr:uncharacterized protein LOC109752410 [Aegilops tauschii subsp. strangulata]